MQECKEMIECGRKEPIAQLFVSSFLIYSNAIK